MVKRRQTSQFKPSKQEALLEEAGSVTIKEAAKLLNVAPSTLRYWEDEGLIRSVRRPNSNYRTYSLHDLFEASYIAFFRNMDVTVKTLAKNQDDTLEEIISMLDATQEVVTKRITRLKRISDRLQTQRTLAMHAVDLIDQGVREACPTAVRFVAYNPESPEQRKALLRDTQRYAVLIDAAAPSVMQVGCMEFASDEASSTKEEAESVLWQREEALSQGIQFFEGVGFSEKGGEVNIEVESLFAQARKAGHTPLYALAHFLVTANVGGRKDCYRVWIACAPEK